MATQTDEKKRGSERGFEPNGNGQPPAFSGGPPKLRLTTNEKRSARASIIIPLIISGLYCAIKWFFLFPVEVEEFNVNVVLDYVDNCIDLLIDYFAVTFISTALYLILQEYVYRVSSYLNDQVTPTLTVMLIIYAVLYALYLPPVSGHIIIKFVLIAYTIPFVVVLWGSLRADIRRVDAGILTFSGHTP